ncbi:MAG TPA: DNA polymerase IV, partial [Giesbergeria sp.]|nr:DNA polymerase IV [Giesbergeria sp.]
DAAWGRDERPVVTDSEPVSISRETTFERDLHAVHDRAELGAIFTDLCQRVAQDLQRKGYVGRTIGIKLRYDDFRAVTRDQTIAEPTHDAATIRRVAGLCLKRVPLQRRIRLLGVRVASLVPVASHSADSMPPGREQCSTLGLF